MDKMDEHQWTFMDNEAKLFGVRGLVTAFERGTCPPSRSGIVPVSIWRYVPISERDGGQVPLSKAVTSPRTPNHVFYCL